MLTARTWRLVAVAPVCVLVLLPFWVASWFAPEPKEDEDE